MPRVSVQKGLDCELTSSQCMTHFKLLMLQDFLCILNYVRIIIITVMQAGANICDCVWQGCGEE